MTRRLLVLAALVVAAAVIVPLVASDSTLDSVSLALALAGPATGAALAVAAGRPPLVVSALAGIGAYTSGLASLHAVPVPLAVVMGAGAATVSGALIALVCARLDAVTFLLTSGLIALALGAGVQALPAITRAQSGLGPLPPLSIQISPTQSVVLSSLGDFHVCLLVAALVTAGAVILDRRGPGPRWRAIGSDLNRAAATGLQPLSGQVTVLALAGLFAGVSGAVAAHLSRVATPSAFTLEMAALPLLAALAARRAPLGAAILAVGTGVVGQLVLPDLGWQGPPPGPSIALGLLGAVALAALIPRRHRAPAHSATEVQAGVDWPVGELGLVGAELDVPKTTRRSSGGVAIVDAPAFTVAAGAVHGVIGANGSGKTTLLASIAHDATGRRDGARVVLLPQEGGGFDNCTVRETLVLAARRGRGVTAARRLADAWLDRLGLSDSADRLCGELSASRRRLVDLARTLLGGPNVLLCDEPLAGLDDNDRAAVIACLRAAAAASLTVVIAEHDRSAVAELASTTSELRRADLSPSVMRWVATP